MATNNVANSVNEAEERAKKEAEEKRKAEERAKLRSEISSLKSRREKLQQEYNLKEEEQDEAIDLFKQQLELLDAIDSSNRNKTYNSAPAYIQEQIYGENYNSFISSYSNVKEAIQDEIDSVNSEISAKEAQLSNI